MSKKRPKRKTIIIVAATIVALLAAVAGGFILFMRGEQKKMGAIQTGEFLPGIHAVNCGFVNMFLIDGGDGWIAVDAGGSMDSVKNSLPELGISSNDVTAVLLTHSHGDHVAALGLFDKAVVYGMKEGAVAQVVSDGEMLAIGGRAFQVIGTPGHADDSVCYLMDGAYLFAGDNLSLADGKVGMFNSVFNQSDERQKEDIARLAGFGGVRYVISAHYGFAEKPAFPD